MATWILAYDGGCSSCRSISERIREAVAGSELELRGLAEPDVVALRRRALGDQPPWLPTLISVDGPQARAWTGAAMSVRLARLLGPGRSIRVIKALAAEEPAVSTGRRRFLKAIPGAFTAGVVVSGGTAVTATAAEGGQADLGLDFKRISGAKAQEILAQVADDEAVAEFSRSVGIDPADAIANGIVEEVTDSLQGTRWYVSLVWADNDQQLVRTSHLVSDSAPIDSKMFVLTKTGPEQALQYGQLGGATTTLTESEADDFRRGAVGAYSDFTDCLADCLGISAGFVTAVLAGCGLVCAITLGTGCIVCAAAAFGFSVGTVAGCFAGCGA